METSANLLETFMETSNQISNFGNFRGRRTSHHIKLNLSNPSKEKKSIKIDRDWEVEWICATKNFCVYINLTVKVHIYYQGSSGF